MTLFTKIGMLLDAILRHLFGAGKSAVVGVIDYSKSDQVKQDLSAVKEAASKVTIKVTEIKDKASTKLEDMEREEVLSYLIEHPELIASAMAGMTASNSESDES